MTLKSSFFIPALLCLALASCATHAEHKAAREGELWAAAGAKVRDECGSLIGKAQTAVEADACISAIVRRDVLPFVHYPDLALQLLEDQALASREYRQGKLDDAQAVAKAKYLQQRYEERVRARLGG